MPSRRVVKKREAPKDLSSDSSLSSVPSIETPRILDVQESTVAEESPIGRSSGRKRRAVTVAKAAPAKRIKTTEAVVSVETSSSLASSSIATKGRKTKSVTKTETEVTGHQSIEASSRIEESETKPKASGRKRKVAKVSIQEEDQLVEKSPKSRRVAKSKKIAGDKQDGEDSEEAEDGKDEDKPTKKVKRTRKTKEEREAEAMPLIARTVGLRMFVGAHVSCAKGVQNAVTNAVHIGGNAFALFLKSQRKWDNPPLQDENRNQFKHFCEEHKFEASKHILPHGSYLVNLAQEDPEKASQAYNAFLDDLHRCEALGIKLYNFHPGNTGPASRPSAISRIADALNRAHAATKRVKPVLENMAGSGNVIGATFEDLRDIIEQVKDKSRIGVCIDTCHSFAAGYDLRTPEAFRITLDRFDNIVGMKYLSALHLNDSKAPFGSHRDLHQNIGIGFLGLRAFHNIMNEPRFEELPMVLETPIDAKDEQGKDIEDKGIWAREIKLLEGLIGMDAEGEEFQSLERGLREKGEGERVKYQDAFERKVEKERKAGEKGKRKKKGEDAE